MRRPVHLDPPAARPQLGAVAAAVPLVLVALGSLLLLSALDVRLFALEPDAVGLLLILIGLVGMLRRLTAVQQDPDVEDHDETA